MCQVFVVFDLDLDLKIQDNLQNHLQYEVNKPSKQ